MQWTIFNAYNAQSAWRGPFFILILILNGFFFFCIWKCLMKWKMVSNFCSGWKKNSIKSQNTNYVYCYAVITTIINNNKQWNKSTSISINILIFISIFFVQHFFISASIYSVYRNWKWKKTVARVKRPKSNYITSAISINEPI